MKKTIIAANWKSNKTKYEAKIWLNEVALENYSEDLEVIIFPPFTLLDYISGFVRVNDTPFRIGAQDVSPFDNGAYTGEISAEQIKEFAEYVLIGHSERRSNFFENNEVISRKIEKALASGLKPIVCVSELSELEGLAKSPEIVFAYEPIASIGSGKPEDPNAVSEFVDKIEANFQNDVIYGGSINKDNIKSYTNLPNLSGVLIGSDGLDSSSFINIIKNAI